MPLSHVVGSLGNLALSLSGGSLAFSQSEEMHKCNCMKLKGYRCPPLSCVFCHECRAEIASAEIAKSLNAEALFKKFVAEFPVLSALDLFCNECGHPMALTYGISNLELFYAEFFCHGAARRVYLEVENFARGARPNRDTVLSTIDMVRGGQP
jgi:hypothetical protein